MVRVFCFCKWCCTKWISLYISFWWCYAGVHTGNNIILLGLSGGLGLSSPSLSRPNSNFLALKSSCVAVWRKNVWLYLSCVCCCSSIHTIEFFGMREKNGRRDFSTQFAEIELSVNTRLCLDWLWKFWSEWTFLLSLYARDVHIVVLGCIVVWCHEL